MRMSLMAVILLITVSTSTATRFILLHTNDMHSKFDETAPNGGTCDHDLKLAGNKCLGGFARLAHTINKLRQEHFEKKGPKVIYLDAGDVFTGSPWFSLHTWKIAANLMNQLKPDVQSLGSHDFDLGVDILAKYLSELRSHVVGGNIVAPRELQKIEKYYIIENVEGAKVGVIGYISPETKIVSNAGETEFTNEIEELQTLSQEVFAEGAHIIIALGHSGFEVDQRIASDVPLVDIVVGGKSHTFLYNDAAPDMKAPEGPYPKVVTQKNGKKVLVVQAYAYTKYLGCLEVEFNNKGDLVKYSGQPIYMSNSVPRDEKTQMLLYNKYSNEVDQQYYISLGRTIVLLDNKENDCRFQECNFGNLITDAYVNYIAETMPTKHWTRTPIAFINAGTIVGSINAVVLNGKLTQGAVLEMLPYIDRLVTFSISGNNLKKALEMAVRHVQADRKGEFLQVSGLKIEYNLANSIGHRVVSVHARCGNCPVPMYEKLDGKTMYNVVTTSFLLNGGDGYHVLKDNHAKRMVLPLSDFDVISKYIKGHNPVHPKIEGRILVVTKGDAVSVFVVGTLTLSLIMFVVVLTFS